MFTRAQLAKARIELDHSGLGTVSSTCNRLTSVQPLRCILPHTTCRRTTYMAEATSVTEPVLLILLSLAEQPRHGYAIMKDVAEMSDDRVRLSTGTLYGALRRMLEDGWITRHSADDTSRGRQDYRLTIRGRKVLQQEVSRVKQLARIAGLRLATTEHGT